MHDDAVSSELIEILDAVGQVPELEPFALGGGTSLALRFGHRRSIDIDLFTVGGFNSENLIETVRSVCLEIRSVKVDLLHHAYPFLAEIEKLNGIRVLSVADVAAMKVNAITNRGSKKDFADLLALHLNGTGLEQSLGCFCEKYGEAGKFLAIRSLQFFDDARNEPDPVFLNNWTWEYVENTFAPIAAELSSQQ